jgi:DNA repair exonuclease SbcCD ATPase subunit
MAMKPLKPVNEASSNITHLRGETGLAPELETLFQASRQVEATLIRERGHATQLAKDIEDLRQRHAQDLARARHQLQQLRERDASLIQQLKDSHARAQAIAAQATQIKEQNARLKANAQEQSRKMELDLTAARSALDHLRGQMRVQEDTIAQLRPELERAREALERAQAEVLEREHRYQAATLTYQNRDQSQRTAINALQGQLKQMHAELERAKARWIETERMRQEAERRRQAAELAAQGRTPSAEKLRKLEEANQFLQERLSEEKHKRKEIEKALPTAQSRQEMDRLRSELRGAADRLAYTEAQLSKASAEAALLKAAHKASEPSAYFASKPAPQQNAAKPPAPSAIELELLEKLALTGYPIQDDA